MLELVLRIGFSLLVVLGLLWVLAKVARRPLAGRGGGAIAVLARQQLTRGSTVAVVRIGGRALILDGQVTLLGEADPAVLAVPEGAGRRETVALERRPAAPGRLDGSMLSPQTWSQTVQFLRERTVRRR